ncbi:MULTISPECIES: autotransporter domain-containing protein [Pasteurellaceae]|uniref:SGNH/GDSL hydrolase family protein n=1 Tax=Pasteurella atlantica TaxID=2827233 RepID=A0AAW8CN09_9PAST|nr:autotransporter domain-containing protein [Pasteurella atlantica]MBR0572854.1 autotransporter domain-containing protein [Pasteurella atlantica]MDP8038782.1 SGNH/GDSL hydrolase family protein [Pasteurella atlantica]MDP8040873.1 SGNH/GDSL hydrolase family protein [Pasteurella atlantica]MDP8042953.1 SGNH/GDSL hydrolase family protein [Pasteurella atlantica]MDP8045040.1 SGNH/GDSL hydrolase family protein [Pasteurella atlantica]
MKIKKSILSLLCLSSSLSFAQDVVVFGDSLSDTGQKNWNNKASYLKGEGNYHLLYNEYFTQALGGKLVASTKGGSNYAYSSGVIVGKNSFSIVIQPNLAIANQINDYLKTPIKKDSLHILWAGGNDMAMVLATAATKKTEEEKKTYLFQSIQEMSQTMAEQWGKLKQAGVKKIIIPTVPNVIYSPLFFNQIGKMAGNQISKKSQGAISTNDFMTIFNNVVEKLSVQPTQNLEDLETYRQQVFKTVASNFGIRSKDIEQALNQAYKETVTAAKLTTTILNQQITAALNQVGGNIVRVDADALMNDILSRPNEYGINNTIAVACKGSTADRFQPVCNPTDKNVADKRLFADDFHPGPKTHKAMADYILNVLQTPKDMAVLTPMLQQQNELAFDFTRTQSNLNRQHRQTANTVSPVVAYQNQKGGNSLHLGAKIQFDPNWQLSVLAHTQKQNLQSGLVNIDTRNRVLSTALRYDADRWYLGSSLQLNLTKLNTQRTAYIGESVHKQSASTNANSLGVSLFGGYEWKIKAVNFSLIADIHKTKTEIKALSERNKGITQMQFTPNVDHSLKTGVGFDLRYQATNWQPYLTTRWIREWHSDTTTINATLNGSTFKTLIPLDTSWINMVAGLRFKPTNNNWYANVGVSRDIGRKDNFSKTSFQAEIGLEF